MDSPAYMVDTAHIGNRWILRRTPMPDIDYTAKTDRDLLIEVVVTTNGISCKLDQYCTKVDSLEVEHAKLRQEHDSRATDCSLPPPRSKKDTAIAAGAGGGIVGTLVILAQLIIDYLSK